MFDTFVKFMAKNKLLKNIQQIFFLNLSILTLT